MKTLEALTKECQAAFKAVVRLKRRCERYPCPKHDRLYEEAREEYGRLLFQFSTERANQNSDGAGEKIVRFVLGGKGRVKPRSKGKR